MCLGAYRELNIKVCTCPVNNVVYLFVLIPLNQKSVHYKLEKYQEQLNRIQGNP